MSGISSALFVPANAPARVGKALASPAHAVIVDLEDAVPEADKAFAREQAVALLGDARRALLRVNGADTAHFAADAAAAAALPLAGIVLPKASPEAVAALGDDGPPVWALVETADGLRRAYDIARMPRVTRLVLGTADLGAELELRPHDGLELLYARSSLVVDSRAAGLPGPLDGPCLDTRDDAALEREARLARALGFAGKTCIHPRQLATVHAAFAPSAGELDWARRVLAAAEDGGAVLLDGAMVDRPVVERARRLLVSATQETP